MSQIFGEITQLGYVVRDIRSSMDSWIRHGVGRGARRRHRRGQPVAADASSASSGRA